MAPPVPTAVPPSVIRQDWQGYTEIDHAVWQQLFRRRMRALSHTASRIFLEGVDAIGLDPDHVPDLAAINARLSRRTGWQAVPVNGFIPAREFFDCLARRQFPTTITVRPPDQLEYLPEPDIFHDVFGHVPLHADPTFAEFLYEFGCIASRATGEQTLQAMARLFWFTVEFGLVREDGTVRVYGSGLISSGSDAANALGPGCARRPFRLQDVVEQPFVIDRLQEVCFVVDSFDQLYSAVREASRRFLP